MNKYYIFLLIFLFIIFNNQKENFSVTSDSQSDSESQNILLEKYNDMLENHYNNIFPMYDYETVDENGEKKIIKVRTNRNAAGFRFFKYFYDNLIQNETDFDHYNQFYCAVSGSIVKPNRDYKIFNILKVKDLNGNCVKGKYFRCCTPCICDIMKYTRVVNTNLEIPKGSGNFFNKNLLTIGDPCINPSNLPSGIDENAFMCNNNLTPNGYRVTNNGELTEGDGRLIIGVLYPVEDNDETNESINNSVNLCITGTQRLLSDPDNLQYGMGDIFVKLSLLNDDTEYTNTINDLCN